MSARAEQRGDLRSRARPSEAQLEGEVEEGGGHARVAQAAGAALTDTATAISEALLMRIC